MTPLLKVTLWFAIGLLGGIFLHPPFFLLVGIGLLCALVGCFVRHGMFGYVFLWTSLFCLGALRWESALWERSALKQAFGQEREAWIQGVVSVDPLPSPYGRQTFQLKIQTAWPLSPQVKVSAPRHQRFAYGERLLLRGRFSPFFSSNNPGAFDRQSYFHGRSIYGTFRIQEFDPILKQDAPLLSLPKRWLFAWKRSLLQKIWRHLPPQEASFLEALLLGERSRIDPQLWDLLSEIGIVHLIAISGLHVGMVVACFLFFLKTVRVPKRWALGVTLVFLWIFVELVGKAPPVLRASVMTTVYLCGKLLWRRPVPFHALAASFLVLISVNPFYLFEPGFQLSFLSVWVILISLPYSKKPFPALKGLFRFPIESFWISAAVWIGLLPVIAWHFHLVSPVAMVANLFAIPHSFLLVVLGLIWCLFGSWIPFVSEGLLTLLSLTSSIGFTFFCFFAHLPFGFFHVGRPSSLFLLFYYLFLLMVLVAPRLKLKRRWLLLSALSCLNLWVWHLVLTPREGPLRVTFFDVGHGDAALCEFPKGGTLLIDGGRRDSTFDAGRDIVAPALWVKGHDRLDAAVLTHADGDHIGGLPTLLRQFRPRALFESGIAESNLLYQEYRTATEDAGIEPRTLHRGDRILGIPDVSLEVLHPPALFLKGTGRDENNNGLVLKMTYGKTVFLFAADLEEEGIQDLLDSGQTVSATILKFPHHGGFLENGKEFLQKAQPDVAVISVGSLYSLPASGTLDQLASLGIDTHQTVQEGAVVIESDGSSFLIIKEAREGRD